MSDSKLQPTILVKKADGTTERISLQEFKKRQQEKNGALQPKEVVSVSEKKSLQTPAPVRPLVVSKGQVKRPIPLLRDVPVSKSQPPRRVIPLVRQAPPQATTPTTPVNVSENHLANATPVSHIFEYPPVEKPYSIGPTTQKKDDHRSLLDEDVSEIMAIKEKNNSVHAPVRSVTFSSSVTIPKDLEARTNALILSWKKGIRDSQQFIAYAIRPADQGGLGLTEEGAQKLFAEISQNATFVSTQGTEPSRPRAIPPVRPPSVPKKTPLQQVSTPSSVIREVSPAHPSASVMGPKEEAASFGLEDFRRLSRSPKTAGEMILSKFNGWKDESYLLYLQVRDSWRMSPLFRLYIEKTIEALEKNATVAAVLENGVMTYEEYLAISEINRKFEMMD